MSDIRKLTIEDITTMIEEQLRLKIADYEDTLLRRDELKTAIQAICLTNGWSYEASEDDFFSPPPPAGM